MHTRLYHLGRPQGNVYANWRVSHLLAHFEVGRRKFGVVFANYLDRGQQEKSVCINFINFVYCFRLPQVCLADHVRLDAGVGHRSGSHCRYRRGHFDADRSSCHVSCTKRWLLITPDITLFFPLEQTEDIFTGTAVGHRDLCRERSLPQS